MRRIVLLGLLGMGGVAHAGGADPGWIVVLDRAAPATTNAPGLARAHGVSPRHVYAHALNGFSFRGSDAAATALARDPRVLAVVPDHELKLTDVAGWGMFRIDAIDAHLPDNGGYTGSGVRIAVIDSGIDLDHPDLASNLDVGLGLNCIDPTALPDDDNGHGTHVAGIAAAAYSTDGYGAVGVAPAATLVPIKSFDATGYGSTSAVLCGVDHVVSLAWDGVPIVSNMSFVDVGSDTPCDDADRSDVLHEAICDAYDAGVVQVAGAGNDAADVSTYAPAAFSREVITVSAIADFDGEPGGAAGCRFDWEFGYECDDALADFSNGGAIDVAAPGVQVYSTVPGGHATKTGTSMAAPHVAGVAALMLEADPTLDHGTIEALLRATGECPNGAVNDDDGSCAGQGAWADDRDGVPEPLVNALRAALSVDGGATEPPPPPVAIVLEVAPRKGARGLKQAALSWSPTSAGAIDVLRDGAVIATTPDDGGYVDPVGKGRQIHTWQVCREATVDCSNAVRLEL